MQASPPCYAHKVLSENIFYVGNLFYYWFKHCSDYLKNLGICLNQICKKKLKQFRNQKIEKRKENGKRIKGRGDRFGPASESAHGPASP
jgi:hypothetical protein